MPVTRTFLFSDIEGSTRSEQQEPVAWASNHALHNRIIEEAVLESGGEIYKNTGDGYQAAFVNAPDALKAALEVQRKLGSAEWQGSAPLRARIALHTGEAEQSGADYLGDDLHRAARVMDAGHGGQILLSLVTSELVREALRRDPALTGVDLRELGVYGLRDIKRPERIFQVVAPGLRTNFPPLRTEKAFFTNLPTELSPFVGRSEEVAALREELAATRLLTITGGGGVGKTRTAVYLAREVATEYPDGVVLIELGPVSDPDLVVQAVASVFGVGESGGYSLRDTLIYYLQKKEVLLVFDNCEHLLDACADFISTLLSKSSALKVIATSRERLDINGETVHGLSMLKVPRLARKMTVADLHQYAAVELFVSEATNADATFRVTDANVASIAEICKRLDGNALAIKLAASLTPTLSVDEMLERLRERFEVLVQGSRQAVPRHKTLKAAIDWSYDLLSPEEATVFRRLAVFAGAWSLKAAESVCVDGKIGTGRLVAIMNGLVRKNLVIKVSAEPESRFGMLETVREYARMQLRGSDEMEDLQLEHAKYFTAFAKHEASKVWGDAPEVGLTRLEQDYDDLVSALEWARKSDAGKAAGLELRLAAELGPFWERRGFLTEGRERLAQALRSKRIPELDRCRVEALEAAARLAFMQHDYPEAMSLYEKSLKLRRQLASKSEDIRLKHGVAGVLNKIGIAAARNGDYELAEQRLCEAMELAVKTKHARGIVRALNNLAELAWRQGDYEGASKRYEECLMHARQQKGKFKELSTLDSLMGQARILMMQGKYDEATDLFTTCHDMRNKHGTKTDLAFSHSDLSEVAYRKGDYETACFHAEESLKLRHETKNEVGIATSLHQLAKSKYKLGLHSEALAHANEGLSIYERLLHKRGIAECLMLIGETRFELGEGEIAARLFGAAEALLDSLGAQLAQIQRDYYESSILASMRDKLDRRTWEVGRYLDMETAVRLAQAGAIGPGTGEGNNAMATATA
ncbi:MAG TPA: tetratricopeptide repeat protein [Chloroflexia bacterium]